MAQSRFVYPTDLGSGGRGGTYRPGNGSAWRNANWQYPNSSSNLGGTPPPSYLSAVQSPPAYPGVSGHICIVCNKKPRYNKNGRSYPTCGLTCAAILQASHDQDTNSSQSSWGLGPRSSFPQPRPVQPGVGAACVVCKLRTARDEHITCGSDCVEKLSKDGGDPKMCDYCHMRPRATGKTQCGQSCADRAKVACLLCKCRPATGRFQLCGKTCKEISTKATPLLLEAPKGHKTHTKVESLFQKAWKAGGTPPTIQKIFKIIENDAFRQPYDVYLKAVGNEQFRYHGTKRECQLGTSTTTLCASATCAICNILKTSFKVSLAANGCFGRGIYSSSSASKAHGYMGGGGVMILTKVVVGKAHPGGSSCPPGYDSVVYDDGGPLNETIVYRDDAIRPVFLIVF